MSNDFSAEYSERGDDELLLLASDRSALTTEAATSLDAELRRRNLTVSDQAKYRRFVKRNEQREANRQRRKMLGTGRHLRSWVDSLWTLMAVALISFTYLALPTRYHMKPDWQEAAFHVTFTSAFIAISSKVWRRKVGFWMSLVISSAIHLVVVHAWMQRAGNLNHSQGKLAILLGFVLFFAVYGAVWMLLRNFNAEELPHNT